MCQKTENTCPIKTYWQEKQCWEYECDKVSGDNSCESLWSEPCEFQKQLLNHKMATPKKSAISKKIIEIRLLIAKSITDHKVKMIAISKEINNK